MRRASNGKEYRLVPQIHTLRCCQAEDAQLEHSYHAVLPVKGRRLSKIVSLGAAFDFESSPEQCVDGIKLVMDTNGWCKDNPYLPATFSPGYK